MKTSKSPRAVPSGSCCFHRNNWARPWITTVGARRHRQLLLCKPGYQPGRFPSIRCGRVALPVRPREVRVFLTVTQTPQRVTAFFTSPGPSRYGVLVLIMLMYLVLGCLMEAMAMIILTIPIILPVVTSLGFDPVWSGVIIVMTVDLGLIGSRLG